MKFPSLILILLIFSSCNSAQEASQETEMIEDSSEYEIEESGEAVEDIEDGIEDFGFETKEWVASEFTKNQFNSIHYHLFGPNDQLVFEEPEMLTEVTNMTLGEQVIILERTGIEFIDFYKYPGEVVKIQFNDGRTGYTFNNYFSRMPHPASNQTYLQAYTMTTFHIVDSVSHKGSMRDGMDINYEMDWEEVTTPFENDITMTYSHSYESGSTVLFVPSISIIEGLLFMDALKADFNLFEILGEYPNIENREINFNSEGWGASYVRMEYSGDSLNEINFHFGDGCSEWFIIRSVIGGIEFETGSGC